MPADRTPPPPSDPPPTPSSGRTRSSTVERERIASILRAAAEAGLLTLDEADERMALCYHSQYRDELAPLVSDLPDGGRGLVPPDPDEAAGERRAARLWLRAHAARVSVLAVLLVGIWAVTGAGFFWPVFPLGFLALSLVFGSKHRERHRAWRAHLAASGGPGDFRGFGDMRGFGDHGCGRGHHGHRWAHDHASRSC